MSSHLKKALSNKMKPFRFASQELLDTKSPLKAKKAPGKMLKKPQMKQYGDPGYEPSTGKGVGY